MSQTNIGVDGYGPVVPLEKAATLQRKPKPTGWVTGFFKSEKNSMFRAKFMNPSVGIAIEILNRLFATHSALQQDRTQYFTYTNYTNYREYRVAA